MASSVAVLEDLLDRLSGPLDDLPGALHRSNCYVSTGLASTLANIRGRIYGMERDQVYRASAGALGEIPCAFPHTFADIARPTADLSSRAFRVFVMLRMLLRNGLAWRGRLLGGWGSCSYRRILPIAADGRHDNHRREYPRFAFHQTSPFVRLDD